MGAPFRKLAHFLLAEGPTLTARKLLGRWREEKYRGLTVHAKVDGRWDAVSYDGGQNYYVSDVEAFDRAWRNPFSYDGYIPGRRQISRNSHIGRSRNELFIIGCGEYVRTYVLPALKGFRRYCCFDLNDSILREMEGTFPLRFNVLVEGIDQWVTAAEPVAIIASYHSDHASIAAELFDANPGGHIFIEKPPCVTPEDLTLLGDLYRRGARIEIGFNRRYSPAARFLRRALPEGPRVISIAVNEVPLLPAHWYFWANQGTRVTGNLCHWVDLCQALVSGKPEEITVTSAVQAHDAVVLGIRYSDGSIAGITAGDHGGSLSGVREYVEVNTGGVTVRVEDLLHAEVITDSRIDRHRLSVFRNKGHVAMYKSFAERVRSESYRTLYALSDLVSVTAVTQAAAEALLSGSGGRRVEESKALCIREEDGGHARGRNPRAEVCEVEESPGR